MWWILLLSFSALAQNDLDSDLDAIRKLDDELPTDYADQGDFIEQRKHTPSHRHPFRKTTMKQILESGTEHGYVKQGRTLIRISDNKAVELTGELYGKFYRLQDEHGFKYIQSNDGSCVYKIKSSSFHSVEPELALYEPPLRYTPAPTNIIRSDVDKKLRILPEVTMLVGMVQGDYMKDLFNDEKAESGQSNQYGLHFATDWKLPIMAGAVVHYEKASYNLSGGGKVNYSSPSLGPQFKTKDINIGEFPIRFQTQFRVSPWARAHGETTRGTVDFKFNSADLLLSAEHPIKNRFGQFVLGLYFQSQWLSIKDQPELVKVNATNEVNKSFGLSLAQVFE